MAWAAGYGGSQGTLIEQWDGATWQMVSNLGAGEFTSVWANSPTDTWAVGIGFPAPPAVSTLIEHWDGTAWSVVPSPNVPGSSNDLLLGVWAASPTTAWAVGMYQDGATGKWLQLIEQLC